MSLLNPHDISYYPRGFTADFKRPDWDVKLPLNFHDDPKTKPYVHQQYHKGLNQIAGPIAKGDDKSWRRLLNTYADLIVGTDTYLAHAFEAVRATGHLEDTVIIRTADHGELGGSHGLKGKGPTMYEEQVRMPLVFSYPKRFPQNARTPAVAEAVDLVPTCLELAGVAEPNRRYPWLRGRSLVPVLENPGRATVKDAALCSCDENWSVTEQFGVGKVWKKHMRALLTPRFKFARYYALTGSRAAGQAPIAQLDDQDFELYDLREDPYELRNLANDPAYRRLREDLHAWQLELEVERYAALKLPDYGGHSLIEAIFGKDPVGHPRISGLDKLNSDPPEVGGTPGNYVQLPFQDPGLGPLIYEVANGSGRQRVQRARELARMRAELQQRMHATLMCDVMPGVTDPRMKSGRY
jgi:hypothetical protein